MTNLTEFQWYWMLGCFNETSIDCDKEYSIDSQFYWNKQTLYNCVLVYPESVIVHLRILLDCMKRPNNITINKACAITQLEQTLKVHTFRNIVNVSEDFKLSGVYKDSQMFEICKKEIRDYINFLIK